MSYELTIGLEIHAELKTTTKMFCSSRNEESLEPNYNVCPVCMAHPGTLPTINRQAVVHVLRVGAALGGTLADYTEFDRKNYFYPDIPKGYQISQYEFPLVSGGTLAGVEITRVHLEEDTARSLHTEDPEHSYVDFNRAGVPLMELVTEPVIHTAEDAAVFARELQLLLRSLDVSDANMEKGQMRVEANISVAQPGAPLGTKVEVKNLNSFRSVERAIQFEVARQTELLGRGETIVQETRGWDEGAQKTFSQRAKEEAADYRYFPDPDLPKLMLSEFPEYSREALVATLPELPEQKRTRLREAFGLAPEAAEAFVRDHKLGAFFEAVAATLTEESDGVGKTKLAANYITNNLVTLRDDLSHHVTDNITPVQFAEIITRVHAGDISSNGAVVLITEIATHGLTHDSIQEMIHARGLAQLSDESALETLVEQVITEHAGVADEYKAGKEQALQFLVGQGMKASKGSANPTKLQELFKQKLHE